MSKQRTIDYYASFGNHEWDRLSWPEGRLEAAVTMDAFDRHLEVQARILDIGGGAGRWTVALASRGYRLTLADLSPVLLDIAKQKIAEHDLADRVEEVIEADVCDLQHWSDSRFDVVLCLGPFYHLTEADDREKAVREIHRILRPGGLVFVAFMTVYAFLRRVLALPDEREFLKDEAFVRRLAHDGVFENRVQGRFDSGYGTRPEQALSLLERHGFESIELLSDTGFAASSAENIAKLEVESPDAYQRIMRLVVESARDKSNLGSSVHMLYVGRKRS